MRDGVGVAGACDLHRWFVTPQWTVRLYKKCAQSASFYSDNRKLTIARLDHRVWEHLSAVIL